jgi:hypothetical protein
MSAFKQKLKEILQSLDNSSKEKLMCLSTTANIQNPPVYFSSIRETRTTIAGSIIFADLSQLDEVLSVFDGKVSTFLVDTEIKNTVCNLVERVKEKIKKSAILYYKPNDIAIDSVDMFLACKIGDLSIMKVCILGAGNMGAKLALSLAERGADINLYDHKQNILSPIIAGLDLIKRGKGRLIPTSSIETACKEVDILIGCTPGIPVINSSHIMSLNDGALVIDLGNGTLDVSAISKAAEMNISLYSPSVLSAYCGLIENWKLTESCLQNICSKQLPSGLVLNTRGLIGAYGSILTDNVDKVDSIYGVCDGLGGLLPDEQAQPFLKQLNSKVLLHDQRA